MQTGALRSAGDFEAMWREMAQTSRQVWTVAHEPLPELYTPWEPCIALTEQDESYLLKAELPGMQQDDITVDYCDGVLTVRGEQRIESAVREAAPRIKHGYRAFTRRFILAEPVDTGAMTISYVLGRLEVLLPKARRLSEREVAELAAF